MDELLTILEEGLPFQKTDYEKQIYIYIGELNRAMASHNLNDMSSRSHAMLSIQIEQDLQGFDDPSEQMTRQGKLVFVDLAGSNELICSNRIRFCSFRK